MTDHHQRKKYLLVTIPVTLLLLLDSTSLVVVEDGNPLTRSRYDPFGDGRHVRVAETQIWQDDSWVSLDPTQAITQTDYLYMGDLLERELNIYFTADGRYYDPWLGKYLQPDAIGGPPLIPQAADRYQYAGNSPTGVGWAAASRGPGGLQTAVSVTLGEIVETGIGRLADNYVGSYAKAASQSSVFQMRYTVGKKSWTSTSLFRQVGRDTYQSLDDATIWSVDDLLFDTFSRTDLEILQVGSCSSGSVFRRWLRSMSGQFWSSVGIGGAIELAFAIPELAEPWQNPYFSPAQRATQNFVTLTGVGASALVGAATEVYLLPALGIATGGPVGFVVVVGVGVGVVIIWDHAVKPLVSEAFVAAGRRDPYQEYYNLMPLGDPQ